MEVWKDVQGFEDKYQISNTGKVKSKPRILIRSNGHSQTVKGRVLKTFINPNGYEFAVFQVGINTKNFAVHRLVAIHFLDNPEKKYAVNHKNGIKTDNDINNLEWVTKSENEIHARKIGLKCTKGEKASKAILTEKEVKMIRCICAYYSEYKIAKMYGVSRSCIASIIRRRSWKHV
jgi:hypothetical protein